MDSRADPCADPEFMSGGGGGGSRPDGQNTGSAHGIHTYIRTHARTHTYIHSDFICDFGKLPFPSHLGNYIIKIGKISTKIHEIGKIKAIF